MSKAPPKPPRSSDHRGVPIHKAMAKVSMGEEASIDAHYKNPFDDEESMTNPAIKASVIVPPKPTKGRIKNPTPTQQPVEPPVCAAPSPITVATILSPTSNNMIYHKVKFSQEWLFAALAIHIGQFVILLTVGQKVLPVHIFVLLVVMSTAVAILLLVSRGLIIPKRHLELLRLRQEFTPDDEADTIPNSSIYCLSAAAVLEGFTYALFAAFTAGEQGHLGSVGLFTQNTIIQTLRFASITLLAFHRVIRPANRLDPMRTMMELEVVSVCWDALDGSTLFELIDVTALSPSVAVATRVLMALWYTSVGLRITLMYFTHLPPDSLGYRLVLPPPLYLAPQPTVDRTMQSLRLRSIVILVMATAEFYAAAIRIYLWSRGQLSTLQQDMCIKNLLFLSTVYGAYTMRVNVEMRDWNTREIMFGIMYPSREFQIEAFRYLFVITYVISGALMSVILMHVTTDHAKWSANIAMDVVLCGLFILYCKNSHVQRGNGSHGRMFLMPQLDFIIFPSSLALAFTVAMTLNLFVARIPMLYYSFDRMAATGAPVLWTYQNALLVVSLTALPIAFAAMFWSVSYMMFRREFTASPGNYNSIHDPTITMVATSAQVEGALDVLSCVSLMQLTANSLPSDMNGACVLFSLLEIFNACQSFALQTLLSGGTDDTPLHLVRWKAFMRGGRGIIDFCTFVLRLVLWVQYDAISSVFLIKNLYNLLHTGAQVERWYGTSRYPKNTMFTEFVPPADWYAMTKEQWRDATRSTLAAQARAGRTV